MAKRGKRMNNVHRVVGCVNNLFVQTMLNVYERLVQSTNLRVQTMQGMLRQDDRFLTGEKDLLVNEGLDVRK